MEMSNHPVKINIHDSDPDGSDPKPDGSDPKPDGSDPKPDGSDQGRDPDPHGSNPDPHGSNPAWTQKIGRLRALKSVNGRQPRVEFTFSEPVYTTAKAGDLEDFIKALEIYSAKEKASLNDIIGIKGPCGNSLFHVTAGIENADILKALLEVNDNEQLVAQANDMGDTALHVATKARSIGMARLLLDKVKIIVNRKNEAKSSALHEAVKNSDNELIDLLLKESSILVNEENGEEKCPLYLAVEMGNREIFSRLLKAMDRNEVLSSGIEGRSPVHGAVVYRRKEMLEEMAETKKELFDLKDAGENTPLHLAAQENYVDGVEFLVRKFSSSAFKYNALGYFPIHIACKMGHLETIKVLRHCQWLKPEEMLTLDVWQNILHVAAKYGRASVVKYILGDPMLEKLINAKDKNGNTPLHIATNHWQPKVLLYLTRDNKVNLELENHGNFTALDIVDMELGEFDIAVHKSLTRTILVSVGAPRSKSKVSAISRPKRLGWWSKPVEKKMLKSRYVDKEMLKSHAVDKKMLKSSAQVRILVATLIAGVTFAAGLNVPGGNNDSQPDAGITTLLNKPMYDIFVICNSIAMYNSIIAVVILLWTQINDSQVVYHVLRMTRLPLLIALVTMSVAFMAGVHVIISKRTWIAIVTLITGIIALFIILILYIALFAPIGYNCRLVRFFTDYIIRAAILISGSDGMTEEASEGSPVSPMRSSSGREEAPKGEPAPEGESRASSSS